MAKKTFLVDIDLNNNQLLNTKFQNLATAPVKTVADAGFIYWDTTLNTARGWTGTAWIDLGSQGVATNLALGTATATTQPITNSNGSGIILPIAVATTSAGLLSGADKAKLNGIATNANVGVVPNIAITGATKTKITYDSKGLVTGGADAGIADISGLQTALDNKENTSNKNSSNGYAGLDATGKINPSQLPALAITDTFVVANQVDMLALTAEIGDIAVRTDLNKSFILKVTGASVLANWQELLTPTTGVSSVFGRSGIVTAQSGDYTADQITETASRVFVSPSEKTAITHSNRASLDLVSGTNTGDNAPNSLYSGLATSKTGKYSALIGAVASTTISAATHGLGSSGLFIVQVREDVTGAVVDAEILITAASVVINFNTAPTASFYRVTIIG